MNIPIMNPPPKTKIRKITNIENYIVEYIHK